MAMETTAGITFLIVAITLLVVHRVIVTRWGSGRIRTSDALSGIPDFESGPFNRSGTLPIHIILDQIRKKTRKKDGPWSEGPSDGS